jgi:hypothetical protein
MYDNDGGVTHADLIDMSPDELGALLEEHNPHYPEWDEAAEDLRWGNTTPARRILVCALDL